MAWIVVRGCGSLLALILLCLTGCYVPLRTVATPASSLPDSFRSPVRSTTPKLNLASLSIVPPSEYVIGSGDALQVVIPGLFDAGPVVPFEVTVAKDGSITLPLAGKINVAHRSVGDAQEIIDRAYNGILVNPRVNVAVAKRAAISVSVIGEVQRPGAFDLPRFEDDLVHALAAAGGLTAAAGARVEVHRHAAAWEITEFLQPGEEYIGPPQKLVLEIPLRGHCAFVHLEDSPPLPKELTANDVRMRPGDVVFVPQGTDEVFFVVGPLNRNNILNFTLSRQDRRLGNAFLLPTDRDIDITTAVAMAGYIDPIESPSTVTVQRLTPGRPPLLIHVDLIAARYDWRENIYVQAGDIVYLNPDPSWYFRRTFDRVVPELILSPYRQTMGRAINPFR